MILGSAGAIVAIMVAPDKSAALRDQSGEPVRLLIIALFVLWGGFALTLFAICAAHAQDRGALTSSLLFTLGDRRSIQSASARA